MRGGWERRRERTRQGRLLPAALVSLAIVAAVLTCVVLSGEHPSPATPVGAADKKTPDEKIVFPPNRAVLLVGTFHVIVRGGQGDLLVDGRPQSWEPFAAPLRVAKVGLNPGLHEIRIGAKKIEFSVGLSEDEHDGPKDWRVHRCHTMPADKRCAVCHETSQTDGRFAVGPLKSTDACFSCHEKADFDASHKVRVQPNQTCRDCHALHDSPNEYLLNDAAKKQFLE